MSRPACAVSPFGAYWSFVRPIIDDRTRRYAFDLSLPRMLHEACRAYSVGLGGYFPHEPRLILGRTLFGYSAQVHSDGTGEANPLESASVYDIASPFQIPIGVKDTDKLKECVAASLAFFEVTNAISAVMPLAEANAVLHLTRTLLEGKADRSRVHYYVPDQAAFPLVPEGMRVSTYAIEDEGIKIMASWLDAAHSAIKGVIAPLEPAELEFSQAWWHEYLGRPRNWMIAVPDMPPSWRLAFKNIQGRNAALAAIDEIRRSVEREKHRVIELQRRGVIDQTTLAAAWCQLVRRVTDITDIVYAVMPHPIKLSLPQYGWAGAWHFLEWPKATGSVQHEVMYAPALLSQLAFSEADAVWQLAQNVGSKWLRNSSVAYHHWFVGRLLLPKLLRGRIADDAAEFAQRLPQRPDQQFIDWRSDGGVDELKNFVQISMQSLNEREKRELREVEHDLSERVVSEWRSEDLPEIKAQLRGVGRKCASAGPVGDMVANMLREMDVNPTKESLQIIARHVRTRCEELRNNQDTSLAKYLSEEWNFRFERDRVSGAVPRRGAPPEQRDCPLPFLLSDFKRAINALRDNADKYPATAGGPKAKSWVTGRVEPDGRTEQYVLTWTDSTMGFTGYAAFGDHVIGSCLREDSDRGLPRVLLFGLEYGARKMEVLLPDEGNRSHWHAIYPLGEPPTEGPDNPEFRFGIRWRFTAPVRPAPQ